MGLQAFCDLGVEKAQTNFASTPKSQNIGEQEQQRKQQVHANNNISLAFLLDITAKRLSKIKVLQTCYSQTRQQRAQSSTL